MDINLDEDPIQTVLGLPEVDRKKTRQQLVDKVFTTYRRWKRQLRDGEEPEIITIARKPKPGYEDATDPDLIRSPSPRGGGIDSTNPHIRRMERFIEKVDRHVERLPQEHCLLIKMRYLTLKTPLPRDKDVFNKLKDRSLIMSESTYDRVKAEAFIELAEALNAMVFDIPE